MHMLISLMDAAYFKIEANSDLSSAKDFALFCKMVPENSSHAHLAQSLESYLVF